jgi:NDP-sugar pyrophosphorylase family protein
LDAFILAAGLGTRLRPLTDNTPKPLLSVGGVALLERVARRLVAAGADRLVINVHHLADQVEAFVLEREGFGVDVHLSHERDAPLDTGGGLIHASRLLRLDGPFFIHNADILTDIDLAGMLATHRTDAGAIATLAVLPATSQRYMLFDDRGLLGVALRGSGEERRVRDAVGPVRRRDFAGVHVIEPDVVRRLDRDGAFSIITGYLELARAGARIAPYEANGALWLDIGTPERLAEADALAREMDRATASPP